jgi:hypothetical protein
MKSERYQLPIPPNSISEEMPEYLINKYSATYKPQNNKRSSKGIVRYGKFCNEIYCSCRCVIKTIAAN